ncbi:hypothetical protein ACFPYI_03295 [Halomarina salina]|uniref:Uncharacterized protein n=1 Tax=Halomarina salina TaxID=1872699 RepID=A0ABD5RJ64_9EURY|nr:hypothetical protein [Halomarina salina]
MALSYELASEMVSDVSRPWFADLHSDVEMRWRTGDDRFVVSVRDEDSYVVGVRREARPERVYETSARFERWAATLEEAVGHADEFIRYPEDYV